MTHLSIIKRSTAIHCGWLARQCLGKHCLFWHHRCSERPGLHRLEGLAMLYAAADLAIEARESAIDDPALRTLLATAEASILRSLLEQLSSKQVVKLLLDWGQEQPLSAPTLTHLARVWGLLRRGEDARILMAGVSVQAKETASLLERIGGWSFLELAFLDRAILQQVVESLPNQHLLPLLLGSPHPVQRQLVAVCDDDRLTELSQLSGQSLPPLTLEDQEELFLTLEAGLAVLAERGVVASPLPGGVSIGSAPLCPLVRDLCHEESCLFWSNTLSSFGWQESVGFCAIQRVNRFLYAPDREENPHRTGLIARWLMAEERTRAAFLFAALTEKTQESVVFWCLTALLDDYRSRDKAREGFFKTMVERARDEHYQAIISGFRAKSQDGNHEVRACEMIHERLFDLVAPLPRKRRSTILAAMTRQDKRAGKLVPPPAWYSFDDLADWDNREIQNLIRELDHSTLLLAFKAASERVREKFYVNLTERAGALLREDFTMMGPVREEFALEAQRTILNALMGIQRKSLLKKVGRFLSDSFSK